MSLSSTKRQVAGVLLVAAPFLALFSIAATTVGIKVAAIIFGSTLLVVICIILGVGLLIQ